MKKRIASAAAVIAMTMLCMVTGCGNQPVMQPTMVEPATVTLARNMSDPACSGKTQVLERRKDKAIKDLTRKARETRLAQLRAKEHLKESIRMAELMAERNETKAKDEMTNEEHTTIIRYRSGSFTVRDKDGNKVYSREVGYKMSDEHGKIVKAKEGHVYRDSKVVIADREQNAGNKGKNVYMEGTLILLGEGYTVSAEDTGSIFKISKALECRKEDKMKYTDIA